MSDDVSDKEFSDIIGLTIFEATAKVKPRGINQIRETSADGEHFMVTADYRTDRLNVGTTDGKITSIGGVG